MAPLREWARRFWGTLRRNPGDQDLEEELRLHLELAGEEIRRRGGSPDEARRAARLQAGGIVQAMAARILALPSPWCCPSRSVSA
jgi:hypothetical protein